MGMDSAQPIRIAPASGMGRLASPFTMTGFAVALLFPVALSAQQGTIAYTFSHQYDFEVPEGWADMMPDSETGTVLLHFGPSASLMTTAPDEGGESAGSGGRMISDRWLGRLLRIKRQSASRRDQEIVRDTWVDYEQGALVETREFMGRMFRIGGSPPTYAWRLTSEQAEHLGRMVIKATAEHDGTSIEAWFTPEIPVSGGPASYGGLPGMILVLSLDGGRTQYFASEIVLEGVEEGLIRAPEDGDEVSREEYEGIVAEKLEELEQLNRRRGGEQE